MTDRRNKFIFFQTGGLYVVKLTEMQVKIDRKNPKPVDLIYYIFIVFDTIIMINIPNDNVKSIFSQLQKEILQTPNIEFLC